MESEKNRRKQNEKEQQINELIDIENWLVGYQMQWVGKMGEGGLLVQTFSYKIKKS